MSVCPGQDTRYWKPEDIFDVKCPQCDTQNEFWKDEAKRRCSKCGNIIHNPRIELGCSQWCRYAEQCTENYPIEKGGIR